VAKRRHYEAPTDTKVTPTGLPLGLRAEVLSLASGSSLASCGMLLDIEGKFKRVSPEFCELVGFDVLELMGKRIDDVTASRSVNIPLHLGAVLHFGRFHGLWMFVHRDGRALLVRNDWTLLADMTIEVLSELIA
jgi:PAS domain S-box-containing protein